MTFSLMHLTLPLLASTFALTAEPVQPANDPNAGTQPATQVPDDVWIQAQRAAKEAQKPIAPVPLPAAVLTADEVDVMLLTVTTFLAKEQPAKAGERFVSAVQALETLTRADKRALGSRYTEQRRQLTALANILLADPAIAAALGDATLSERPVPTPAEMRSAVAPEPNPKEPNPADPVPAKP